MVDTKTIDNLTWLAINAYHEARSEPDEGIKAVCQIELHGDYGD